MSAPFLIDLSHTSHTRARTGIQRVARSLLAALGEKAEAVTYDPYAGTWRRLEKWEQANLDAAQPVEKRGARWPLAARIRGHARRLLSTASFGPPTDGAGIIHPELFSPDVAAALPRLQSQGPRVAVFHDAIPLKLPELSPIKTVARFPSYLLELLDFDGIAAVSEDSAAALRDYWRWLGKTNTPPVRVIGLGVDNVQLSSNGRGAPEIPAVLSVGSIEGRKNHRALLEACELLWTAGKRFELRLVGLARAETGGPTLSRIAELQAAGRPLHHERAAGDKEVEVEYSSCTFTVYPSLLEGFGLPVIESLVHEKPCICSGRGALGEIARDGGCIMLDQLDPATLANAMDRLLSQPAELKRLVAEARARPFKSWASYAAELTAWMATLPKKRGD